MVQTRSTAARTVVGAAALALGLGGCSIVGPGGRPAPTVTVTVTQSQTSPPASVPTTTTPRTTPPTTTPTSAPKVFRGMPVYFVTESAGSFRLVREFRTVTAIDGPISSTISAMTRLVPLDPDYGNPWRSASRVYVADDAGTLVVDLSADAFRNRNVGSELASVAIQQLVYAAFAAARVAGNDAHSVVITVDGHRYDAWGVVHLGGRIDKAPLVDVQAQAWVVAPQQGDVLTAGRVAFVGYGTSFEGTFHWSIRSSNGTVVARGTAQGGSMGTFGQVRWSATLGAGTYTVRLATDDPSGGAGAGPAIDTKRFVVR